jgi:hypothetical protein
MDSGCRTGQSFRKDCSRSPARPADSYGESSERPRTFAADFGMLIGGCEAMNARLTFGLLACLLGPLAVGCTTAPGVVRGQNPAGPDTQGVQHAQYHGDPHGPVTPAGGYGHGSCQHCGQQDCDGGCCNLFGSGNWQPTHYHWHTYEAPRNLVYPPQNVPASVVSYPYYTCKGPDCFFKKF